MGAAGEAVYAGIVVSDVDASTAWYERTLGCATREVGPGWACLDFPDGTAIELFAGDPQKPGLTFPSYAAATGPPVLPGFALEDPDTVLDGLIVVRSLPGWHVVVAPDGLRMVLTVWDSDAGPGLAGFRFTSPKAGALRRFLEQIGLPATVTDGRTPAVVPVVAAGHDGTLVDPDGTTLQLRLTGAG